MSDSNSESRFDRIERAIQSLVEVARSHEDRVTDTESRLERLEALAERNLQSTQRLVEAQQQMLEIQDQDRIRFESTIASINAAIDRIDRVMDYLMRRDGDRTDEE
jgi:TolA-binding protein